MKSTPVSRFISEHVTDKLSMNRTDNPGAHNEFITGAAKKTGLEIRKVGLGSYFYKNGSIVGGVRQMVPSLTGSVAISACANKKISKELFDASSVPVPAGRTFKQDCLEDAQEYFASLGVPVVVKPVDGGAGEGVSANIATGTHFQSAWEKAIQGATPRSEIMVEQFISGFDVRAYVVGGHFVAAATRLPAYVTGDGKSDVSELISLKTSMRKINAYLRRMPIIVDPEWVKASGASLDFVPARGEVVTLNGAANIHQGGEHVDVTGLICDDLKNIAVKAAASIPGLVCGGIDLLVSSLDTSKGAVVLEANAKANISVHHLPAYGQPVDVGSAIVREMLRTDAIRTLLSI